MRKMAAFAAAALLTVALAAVLAGCGQDGAKAGTGSDAAKSGETFSTIRIGTMATEDILPLWVAEDEGLFDEAGVGAEVVVFQSATELIAGVTSGEVDLAMTDPMVTASISTSGTPVRIQWVTLGATADQGRFGIMSADDSVRTLADLEGKQVGVGSNTILEYVMDKLLDRAGIARDAVQKSELQKMPVRYEAMASGQVAAAALPASLLALGETEDYRLIADDTQGENLSQSVMIVREAFLGASGTTSDGKTISGADAVEKLKGVWNAAAAKVNASPESYRTLLVQKANLSDKVAGSYPISTYPECAMPEQKMIDSVLEWMVQKGYLAASVRYNAHDGSFS